MKNLIKGFAFSLTLVSSVAFAGTVEEKVKTSDIKISLPDQLPIIETPAPEKVKPVKREVQYTGVQKASIVELTLSHQKNIK